MKAAHLTSLDFDRLGLGNLASGDAATLRAHLDACPDCQQRQEHRHILADQFAREVLPRSLPVVRERLSPHGWWSRPWRPRRLVVWLALAPAVCGVVLALALVRHGKPPVASLGADASDISVKGRGGLTLYVRHGSKVARFAPGAVLEAGDAIRFTIEPRGNAYLLIVGVDGAGAVSAYYPFGRWQSAPVTEGVRFEVPGSVVLDDSPGPERIFALLSPQPLDGTWVRTTLQALAARGPQAIRSAHALQLPGAETWSVVFEKRETPR
jgi:hypothetical protein